MDNNINIIPERLRGRPRDHRGFVVPYFVSWFWDGKPVPEGVGGPDFRVVDTKRMVKCVKQKLCWLCGQPLGVHMAFVLGPMCTINRVISEPPSHRECAEYAMRECPFLSRPRMRRNDHNMQGGLVEAAGVPNERNPGTMALWVTKSYKPFKAEGGHEGVLFRVGDPETVVWYREGRVATRAEAIKALVEGADLLRDVAASEGTDAVNALNKQLAAAMTTVAPAG